MTLANPKSAILTILDNCHNEHVDENSVVHFSRCHGFGKLGAESVVRRTLTFTTCLGVLSNHFRFHQLEREISNWVGNVWSVIYMFIYTTTENYSNV